MLTIRRANDRFHTQLDWLDSRHTFSFADHYHPDFMGFRGLRVINEDYIKGGAGFPMHPHRDMEIVTYMLGGALEHKDSMGNGSVIRPGEVQRMTAGTGVFHSEFNASRDERAHLLQIWMLPDRRGYTPGYEQKLIAAGAADHGLHLIAARDARSGAVHINTDSELYSAHLAAGSAIRHSLRPGRHAWLQVASGEIRVNGQTLEAGDGAAASDEGRLEIVATSPSELLLFDLG